MTGGTKRKRLDPKPTTLRELYLYCGNQCAYPDCAVPILDQNGALIGEIAHIHGVELTAPRGQHSLTNEELRQKENLLLLCRNHHKIIDSAATMEDHSVETLRAMKLRHENRFRRGINQLERTGDVTLGVVPRYAENALALGEPEYEDDLRDQLAYTRAFADRLKNEPPEHLILLEVILAHGKPTSGLTTRLCIAAPRIKVENLLRSDWNRDELFQMARSLQEEGLVLIQEDEGIWYFGLRSDPVDLTDPDLFLAAKEIANGDRDVLRRMVIDLDFSLFDKESDENSTPV